MNVTTTKWTLDDYHRMIEVGLISGRHPLNSQSTGLLQSEIVF